MKANELIHKLSNSQSEDVIVKIEGGLFYPIIKVDNIDGRTVIVCRDVRVPAESSCFEPLEFKASAKKK